MPAVDPLTSASLPSSCRFIPYHRATPTIAEGSPPRSTALWQEVALVPVDPDRQTRDNLVVGIVPRGLVDQGKIRAGVQRAERALSPNVIRIMHSFAEDVQGDFSLFFRIVISDAVSNPIKLRETTQRIIARVLREIKSEDLGLQTYFNFRSESEQAMLRDPFWERP